MQTGPDVAKETTMYIGFGAVVAIILVIVVLKALGVF